MEGFCQVKKLRKVFQIPKRLIPKDNNGTSWPGLIDDFRLYDRALEVNEILDLASGSLPVQPAEKLSTTWANLKQKWN